ncbi:type II toxin-antitoxin system HigB family toxin [Rothia nasimurium]|uniref:Type II toxin-antitoxin system HigB family toxin n=1 Tax=Luteibacter anthropi TaxID=564369 RepID=A0A7X5ZJ23_9GAMM|nr:type II toxin-antitoxin system HigB family toxin [Luteibacter anthropi]NII07477.1 type II toxin-antitoxin system HigB family toxin [Luteibacter anthropi]
MRVISNRRLVDFAYLHPDAGPALQAWRKLLESRPYLGFNELRQVFRSVDIVGDRFVFDIRGNRYRLIAAISFSAQICYIKAVLTHAAYDRGHWK